MELIIEKEIMNESFTKYHIRGLPFDAVIHHFKFVIPENAHDHPWGFKSYILKGGYIEKIYFPIGRCALSNGKEWTYQEIYRKSGTTHFVKATDIHEIIEFPEGECWTLVLPEKDNGRKSRFWKFDDTGIYSRAWDEPEFIKH